MPKYWLISDRNNGGVTYWVSDTGSFTDISNWKKFSGANFQTLLAAAADAFLAIFSAGSIEPCYRLSEIRKGKLGGRNECLCRPNL